MQLLSNIVWKLWLVMFPRYNEQQRSNYVCEQQTYAHFKKN